MDETENVVIPAGDESTKLFNFNETVELEAGKTYEIRFELVNGYPDDCSIENVYHTGANSYDETRRRLTDTDTDVVQYSSLNLDSSPSSCVLGSSLAQSDDMKTGVAAMCKGDLDTRPEIEAGLYRQHSRLNIYSYRVFAL